MKNPFTFRNICTLALGSMLLMTPALSQNATAPAAGHAHAHPQNEKSIYNGYFENAQIKARPLSDWEGEWQSVYPLLKDGTLDPVMEHKAAHGDKSAGEYRSYYEIGYRTEVGRITIKGASITFEKGDQRTQAAYAADGYEILAYKKGNRGVRFIFKMISGDDSAPKFIQFSDHRIESEKSDHFHLYSGNDRAALLKELTNWPTYYPLSLSGEQIAEEMMQH